MANGLLGKKAIPANTDQVVYTVPNNLVSTFNISVCNRLGGPIPVRVWVGSTAPSDDDVLEYDSPIPANGVLERTGIVAAAGEKVVVRSASASLTVRVHGFEEAA